MARGITGPFESAVAHLKDLLMFRYAELVYYSFWFSPGRETLQALIDKSQDNVEDWVRLKLYKVIVAGRKSPKSLYSAPSSPSRTTAAPMTRRMRRDSSG